MAARPASAPSGPGGCGVRGGPWSRRHPGAGSAAPSPRTRTGRLGRLGAKSGPVAPVAIRAPSGPGEHGVHNSSTCASTIRCEARLEPARAAGRGSRGRRSLVAHTIFGRRAGGAPKGRRRGCRRRRSIRASWPNSGLNLDSIFEYRVPVKCFVRRITAGAGRSAPPDTSSTARWVAAGGRQRGVLRSPCLRTPLRQESRVLSCCFSAR